MRCFCFSQRDEFKDEEEACQKVMPLSKILKGMSQGTIMYKVRSADKWYRRKYRVDMQNMRLSYTPSKKPFWRRSAICKCGSFSQLSTSAVDIFNLEEVRKGWHSDVFNVLEAKFRRKLQARLHPQLLSILKEENCFSLIIGPSHMVLDLIAPNTHARDAWVRGLRQLIACCKHLESQHEEERWIKEHVRKADVNGNGSLTFEECLTLLQQLNISMRRREVRELFNAANFNKVKIDGEDALEPDEFLHFYRSLVHRPELEEIMKEYSLNNSTLWGPEELLVFLLMEQNMRLNVEECEDLISEYEPDENKIPGYLSLEGFQRLMLSDAQDVFNQQHRVIYQDMTHPLTHYYISSSHNTYLIGGQLIGDSSIEGYIQALTRGCRCLELDTWDGPDEEPIIFHGYTITSRIFLRDVLEAIKKYAFKTSQYPVILSIENHCSLPYQVKMAQHFENILGEYLHKSPIEEDEEHMPSPEALSRKIFIKGKKREAGLMFSSDEFYMLEDEEEREEALAAAGFDTGDGIPAMAAPGFDTEDAIPTMAAPGFDTEDGIPAMAAAPSHAKGISPELSDLVNYFSARRFTSFAECDETWRFNEMASFQETVALNLGYYEGQQFVNYNKKNISRIYPKGTRTDSGNYDPIPFWNLGCQLVALNYQTWDQPMYINEAKFAQNGRCGYVLKPKYLIENGQYDPSKSPNPKQQLHVTIKVISAQFLPKPNQASDGEVVDPYVSIKVVGHPLDLQKTKTKFISNNGFNPTWNQNLTFVINAPEEAIFHFRVKDENLTGNSLIGQFALPCTSMVEGYRHVHLEDTRGQRLEPSTLFVHIKMTQKVRSKP
ncbi:1-phosphatidylinositol 4,5-bisphosphate phosphodiesterase zeta-1 isoform X2 [Parasteatoda tepidariorum]|uniref:1-phosphatidylinositol 4,5-bisphosphate phosphodiesterase zeta-1 isoform X2 n=1 Tax=Parasteatoda tepidariorum TaxID=114398 RepID=UPI001C71C9E9|nr:1-phosphatidylinositol 4,5-bisphosphate phosphodiesterase eta-2 isoform X1 [Parasteatoda tepidariorum]